MNIAVFEPYYGGSHRRFLDDLDGRLGHRLELFTLPARGWKWRMRLAAPYFAERLAGLRPAELERIDCLLCSSFVDVAAFRGLLPPPLKKRPILAYFHENQFAYPVQIEDERDLHFALTNLTTALAADRIAFNSRYNLESLLAGAADLLRRAPDTALAFAGERIRAKAVVLPPGFDFSELDRLPEPAPSAPPTIVWNHRWEHDKNPEAFFAALFDLDAAGHEFSLVVVGESFRHQPPIFAEARRRLGHRIRHFGYAPSRQQYLELLKDADLVVSTASHEFFGMAVIEAVRAGCRPLLPNRLAYPELFPADCLYEEGSFAEQLTASLCQVRLAPSEAKALTDRFSWQQLLPAYDAWLRGNGDD